MVGGETPREGEGGGEADPVAEAPALSAELKKDACHIIDEYMCDGANTPINLPSANPFKKRSNKTPDEKFSVVMFDKMAKIIYKGKATTGWNRYSMHKTAQEVHWYTFNTYISTLSIARSSSINAVQNKMYQNVSNA